MKKLFALGAIIFLFSNANAQGISRRFSFVDPDPSRVIYTPTAFMRNTKGALNFYNLGYIVAEFVNENKRWSFLFHTLIPISVIVVGPGVKFSFSLAEKASFAFLLHGGFAMSYIDEPSGAFSIGGQPFIFTLGSEDVFVNLSLFFYEIFVEDEYKYILNPNAGFSARVTDRVRLNAEIHFPIVEGVKEFMGGVFYGIRIMSHQFYGDIAFIIPLYEEMSELMRYLPLGIPFISFGVGW